MIKKLWIDALRSGKYNQGIGKLKFVDSLDNKTYHCCLGVLCEIAIEQGVQLEVKDNGIWTEFSGERTLLPAPVISWAGVSIDGTLDYDWASHSRGDLASLNDSGKTFEEIADIIENNLVMVGDQIRVGEEVGEVVTSDTSDIFKIKLKDTFLSTFRNNVTRDENGWKVY